jgi:hypothetical protein
MQELEMRAMLGDLLCTCQSLPWCASPSPPVLHQHPQTSGTGRPGACKSEYHSIQHSKHARWLVIVAFVLKTHRCGTWYSICG